MKRLVYVLLVIILLAGLGLTACAKQAPAPAPAPKPAPAPAPKPEPVTLTMVFGDPLTRAGADWAKLYVDRVNELGKGELVIDVKGGPEVISPMVLGNSVKDGIVDIGYVWAAAYKKIVPIDPVLCLSLLSVEEEVEKGIWDMFQDEFHKAGLHFLGRIANDPPMNLGLFPIKEKVTKPADLKGMRLGWDTPKGVSFWKEDLGLSIVSVTSDENYGALERNLVDLVFSSWNRVHGRAYHEVAKYALNERIISNTYSYIMNLDAWNKLSPSQQDILKKAILDIQPELAKMSESAIAEQIQKCAAEGMEWYTFASPSDSEWWKKSFSEATWKETEKDYPEIVAKYKHLVSK